MSTIIHHEDGGAVYSSIRDDGKMLHWCDKCKRLWISQETPEDRLSSAERETARRFVIKLQEALRLSEKLSESGAV